MGWPVRGAAYWTLIEHFDTANALPRHATWSDPIARERVSRLLAQEFPDGAAVVVALGRAPARALPFSASEWVYYEWRQRGRLSAVMIPHTSGLNRMWNEPHTERRVRTVLLEALERAA